MTQACQSSSKEINHEYYKHYWNENMIDYLNHSAGSRWFNHLLELLLSRLPRTQIKSVADVGCGVGNKTAMMARYYPEAEVSRFDFSAEGIEAARQHHRETNLQFATEDITESSYGKRFDLITAFDVLEHIEDWETLTRKLIDVNNRYMIICSPVGRMRPYEVHIGHFRNFKVNEIESFMEGHGYKTLETFYAGFPFYSPILRDLTNRFYKNYADLPQSKMSFVSKRVHDLWYVLFRFCSTRKRHGDIFVGLFEKVTPGA